MAFSNYLKSFPLNNVMTTYNGKQVPVIKPMGECVNNSIEIVNNLPEYNESSYHVMCFLDLKTNKLLDFMDKSENDNKIQHHVFLYNNFGIIDPLLGYHFNSLDDYFWVISQFLKIPENSQKIGVIYHKLDNIYCARCKIEKGEMVRLDKKYFYMINSENLNRLESRCIS